jgi:hypothetical protein
MSDQNLDVLDGAEGEEDQEKWVGVQAKHDHQVTKIGYAVEVPLTLDAVFLMEERW